MDTSRRAGRRSPTCWRPASSAATTSAPPSPCTTAAQCVVDVAGGSFHADGGDYDRQTLQLVFSTTKGITALAVAMCVERGLLDYDAPVSTYWPEFAAEGKGEATVAQLLSHQCGLITVDGITLEEALDWDTVTGRLAATAPDWPIGTRPRLPRPDVRLARR